MFFRLCNSPATFQAMMNDILKDELNEGWVIVYMDDILIFKDQREIGRNDQESTPMTPRKRPLPQTQQM